MIVWTPKRIVLLVGGFLLFTLAYIVYSATSLGRINTLPPLPDYYQCNPLADGEKRVRIQSGPSPLEKKMAQAFGIGCRELKWPVLLDLNAKSMVLAAGMFEVVEDGRMKLEPMSIGLFGKKKNDGREVEINTLRCKQAYITFDRPVTSLSPTEMNGRKIVKAELFGEIVIVNNRRTALRDDDLTVTIDKGPLYYFEKNQFIRTNDEIHLTDGQLTPPKADIRAKGMEMELATSAPPSKPGVVVYKPKNESISGVKRIVLKQDVTMHLYVSGGTPFPGGDKPRAAPASKSKDASTQAGRTAGTPAAETSHVVIRTPGRFQYDLFKDHDMAHFDVPDNQDQPNTPQDVTVVRINERLGTNDQLVCKHLELRVKRRDGAPPAAGAAAQQTEQSLEIETAHATGPEVTLTSDAEKLDAHGNDFFYDAARKLTILKGTPYMEANKDDSLIQAPELRMQDIVLPTPPGSPPKTYQQVHAKGPGSIHMTNKTTGKRSVHAFWNDKLISTRDGELDLLILIGSARFVDDEHEQSLKAETLKVWLLAEEKKLVAAVKTAPKAAPKAPAVKASAAPLTPEQGRRPHHLEALRNVLLQTPEMTIHDASRLLVRFTDVPASRMPPPAAAKDKKPIPNQPGAPAIGVGNPSNQPGAPATGSGTPSPALRASGPAPMPVGPQNKPAVAVNPAQAKPGAAPPAKIAPEPARPIDLTARSIEAEVLRCGERSVLDHLWAEGGTIDNKGGVRVHQDPTRTGEQGVHIEGNTLDMKCSPEGNMLVVTGDLAQLEMDKILILGPEVNIDQAKNKAWVFGEGAMRMQSNQTLEGKPLGRTVPLTVHWSQDMLFSGEFAEFRGGIQAEQENARLACQCLQVFFDRPISLKEGGRGEPAKVRNLVGNKDVRVEDSVVEQNKLLKYQLLEGNTISMRTMPRDDAPPVTQSGTAKAKSSDANEVFLYGPGSVRILQRGGADLMPAPGKPAPRPAAGQPPAPGDQEMKLTYVSFMRQMKASSLTNTADFWESVRVLNLPCEDPHREIDLDAILATELPLGAMYLRCNRLKVLSEQVRGKTNQQMEADGQVQVQAREFWAQSDHMTYNEAKDQVIFTGKGDNLATLAKIVAKGVQPEVLRAKKIIYARSSGTATVDRGESLNGN
jgi:lipopolysaccharide export system protein LptA